MFDIFADPYADARAFYGQHFHALLRQQAQFDSSEQDGWAIAPTLVDDVAGQVVGGPTPWRCAWALRLLLS